MQNYCKWLTSLNFLFAVRAELLRLRPPNTHISDNESLGSLLLLEKSLYSVLLAKPPRTGERVQEASIQCCIVVIWQLVWALVWTNPWTRSGMEIAIPSILGPDNMDKMDES